MKIWQKAGVAFVVAIALDSITKVWAEQSLAPHHPVPVLGDYFQFTLGYNTGVAFGMFANGGNGPLLVTGVVILAIIAWLGNALRTGELTPAAAWPVGLLLGGAIANFVDRLPDGRVTDFLDAGLGAARWPTFNVADSFIVIALATLMLISLIPTSERPENSPARSEPLPDHHSPASPEYPPNL
jgi:signal peptidase II